MCNYCVGNYKKESESWSLLLM